MLQSLNSLCSIYRDATIDDDAIGGAVPTKSAVYTNIKCRVSSVRPSQIMREQGLETPKLYNIVIQQKSPPNALEIRENDEFYLTSPSNHELHHLYIQIDGVQIDSIHLNDPRRHIELTLSRFARSRTE